MPELANRIFLWARGSRMATLTVNLRHWALCHEAHWMGNTKITSTAIGPIAFRSYRTIP